MKMKCCILLVVLVAFASGSPSRWVYVPDSEGEFYWEDLSKIGEARFDPFKDVVLNVYTRKNPSVPQVVSNGDIGLLANTNLDLKKPVKFIIHGWINKAKSEVNRVINNAFQSTLDINVVVVDWSAGATTIVYPAAAAKVNGVGEFVARVIDWMVGRGAPLRNIHLIGHSLGAHVAGHGGRNVKSGKIAYITGLDPAKPMFENLPVYESIRKEDANYVEIIHTDTNTLGIRAPIGHADFYPNGGKGQPGCLTNTCDHLRAFHLFGDSIDHKLFSAQKCVDLNQAEKQTCTGSRLHMGGSQPKTEQGIFHLKTNSKEPYFLG